MGYRVFKDSHGIEWQTWDVVPQLAERRTSDRRRARSTPAQGERRQAVERRILIGRRPILSNGLDSGWLCFEAPVEKRRLTPIPRDWERCEDARLEQYCRAAKPAPRVSPGMDVSAFLGQHS